MSLNIKNEEAHRLASELAALTGTSMTEAVISALRERLDRDRQRFLAFRRKGMAQALDELAIKCGSLQKYDERTPEEIIGYDENGLPS